MSEWQNKIIRYGEEDPEQLLANPNNARIHPELQQSALKGSLEEIGWIQDIIVNLRTSEEWGRDQNVETMVDGHLRVKLALRHGQPLVPVKYVDLTPDQERLALAVLDPITGYAEIDKEIMSSLLDGIELESPDLTEFLCKMAEDIGFEWGDEQVPEDPGPQTDRAAELQEKWQCARGQIWEIGRHRLMCGDCTDSSIVDLVLQGDVVDLGLTSPPYAVGKEYETGVNFSEHLALLRDFADQSLRVIKPGGFLFINFGEIAPQSHTKPLTDSNRQCLYPISKDYWQIFHVERGMDLYAQRIWYKPFNRLQQPFWTYKTSIPHYQEWEHIWTWRLPGGESDECYDWDISSRAVWDTRNEAVDDKPLTRHVAAFPVGIPERAIKAHSAPGAIVWDAFGGSGTTLVVGEQTNRIVRITEIKPEYCAVTLERLSGMGLEPRLIEG